MTGNWNQMAIVCNPIILIIQKKCELCNVQVLAGEHTTREQSLLGVQCWLRLAQTKTRRRSESISPESVYLWPFRNTANSSFLWLGQTNDQKHSQTEMAFNCEPYQRNNCEIVIKTSFCFNERTSALNIRLRWRPTNNKNMLTLQEIFAPEKDSWLNLIRNVHSV